MGVAYTGDRGQPVVASEGNTPTFGADLTAIAAFAAKSSFRRFTTLVSLLATDGVTPGDLAVADDAPSRVHEWDGTSWRALRFIPEVAFAYSQTLIFASTGVFEIGDYPGVRALRPQCIGAGGAGAGSSSSAAGGGAGGTYAEKFITDIDGLPDSVPVTVGAGAPAPSSGNNGADGGDSSFGSLVVADGGGGGSTSGVGGLGDTTNAVGDLIIKGSDGGGGGTTSVPAGGGGASGLGFGGATRGDRSNVTSGGDAGSLYGGGGSGGRGTSEVGGAGANGLVRVDLYY